MGGECAVSVAPFAELARRYPDDLAIIWIDSNPDIGTPASEYPGFHAMAVAALTGHGDAEVLQLLPATVPGDRVALAGLHAWTVDDITLGWHAHPGATLVMVTRGTVTRINAPGCTSDSFSAGQCFAEDPNVVHVAFNKGSEVAETYVAFIVPVGAPLRIDQPAPPNCTP